MSLFVGFLNRSIVCGWLVLPKVHASLLSASVLSLLPVMLVTACHVPASSYVGALPQHTQAQPARPSVAAIPAITTPIALLPAPNTLATKQSGRLYTVSVNRVPASDVLMSMARDTGIDLTVVGRVEGKVTLNAVNQPMSAILDRLQQQVPIRYRINGNAVTVSADLPFLKSYAVDYLNISRRAQSSVSLATQIGSLKTVVDGAGKGQTDARSNGSTMQVYNESENRFWDSLVNSVAGLIGDPVQVQGATKKATAGNIFVNRESGILSVRATDKQHRQVESLINRIVGSAKRQVLIEATVVEVTLSDSFESGVDWQILDNNDGTAIDYAQLLTGSPVASEATTPKTSIISYRNSNSRFGYVGATIKLLQQFGDVQVLSSPKIIALNNQPAVLKVVDNRVYFTFEIERSQSENGDERTVVDSEIHSVPIGLVMSVTPFINDTGEVILNVRPTISRILNFANDPSPTLAGQSEVQNLIPEIQVREMESLLRVQSGDVAIIGGLMQNRVDDRNTGVPLIGSLPVIGKVFSQSTKSVEKTELLVFLRPTVLQRNASARYEGRYEGQIEGQIERHMKQSINSFPTEPSGSAKPSALMDTRQFGARGYPDTSHRTQLPYVPPPEVVR